LTSALVGGEWSASRPGRFTPGTHSIGGCVGPRAHTKFNEDPTVGSYIRGENRTTSVVLLIYKTNIVSSKGLLPIPSLMKIRQRVHTSEV
jgi:hypothetical protein